MRNSPVQLGTFLLLLCCSWLQAQEPASTDASVDLQLLNELQRAQSLLDELDENYTQMDPRLAEPLFQVAEHLMRVGRYGEAHRQLDRGMQIVRVSEGLYTLSQRPWLKKKIENFANWGDWDSARSQLQHALWLYRNKSAYADVVLASDFLHLSDMHLRGILEDSEELQSYHFRRAVSTNWMALAVGEAIWGKQDRRLAPILYGLLRHYHLQAMAVDWGGRTGYELRQVAPGSDWVRDRSEVRRFYYFTGLRLLSQLQSIYSSEESMDAEALGMANLYLADWQALFGRHGEALESYREAYQSLQAAAVDSGQLTRFFSQPSVLPAAEFYPSVEQALAARELATPLHLVMESQREGDFLYFAEWGPTFPYVNRPSPNGSNWQQPDSNFALFSFNLAGVSEIPLFADNRNSAEFSRVQDPRLLGDAEVDSELEERLLRRLRWLKFRPKLLDGLPQEAVATLHYQLAAEP